MKKHLFSLVALLLLFGSCTKNKPTTISLEEFMTTIAANTVINTAEIINQNKALIYTSSPEKVYAIPLKNGSDLHRIQEYLVLNEITINSIDKAHHTNSLSMASLLLVFMAPLLYVMYALVLFFVLKNIVRQEFHPQSDKLVWVILVLFAPFIGFLLYYFYGRKINK